MQISVVPTQGPRAQHSLHSGVIGVFTGLTRTLSRYSWIIRQRVWSYCPPAPRFSSFALDKPAPGNQTYLITSFTVEQDPSQFNDFGRVFGDIDAVFVASSRNVDDHVSVELGDRRSNGGHGGWIGTEIGKRSDPSSGFVRDQ